MSAALQLPMGWGAGRSARAWEQDREKGEPRPAVKPAVKPQAKAPAAQPPVSLAFYRKHTEKMLRRYLYASMQVGRAPSILGDPIARGWVSSRPVRTFEDAVIFVLDVENCLNQLGSLDRQLLCRIAIQEYTQSETATLLGMSVRTVSYKFPMALDRLTEKLLDAGLLVLPA
ncbi:MAG: sigma factor-like helix-turn-helix DNA-binding protein [Terracidiphilus sp.]|nr:sigma factor-like helix-turn-helix DNA-binding protein [Terracidiphilus sp.]